MREIEARVVVVGAGPAGLTAAVSAAETGVRVVVLDDNPHAGGQIWRHSESESIPRAARRLFACIDADAVRVVPRAAVVAVGTKRELFAVRDDEPLRVRYERLVLATGARELLLPFPGWTLPGVYGAGGLQALVKSGFDVTSQRVVVAGSGPLLYAVASYLRARGAAVVAVVEQAPFRRVARFAAGLALRLAKLGQAAGLAKNLRAVPKLFGAWPVAAFGGDRLEAVEVLHRGGRRSIPCDALACGFGLVPEVRLAVSLGLDLDRGRVAVDRLQRSSDPDVFCAGELTGIAGVDAALIEGQVAGLAACGAHERAMKVARRLPRERRFARRLNAAFALRGELKDAVTPETIVCRCEDVSWQRVRGAGTMRDAKLGTRCGMGPCQGRVCGPILEFLQGWPADRVRPPVFPIPLKTLAAIGAATRESES